MAKLYTDHAEVDAALREVLRRQFMTMEPDLMDIVAAALKCRECDEPEDDQ